MKEQVKEFFITLWYIIAAPYYWLTTRKVAKRLDELGEEWRRSLITERDVEFLRSIGVETDLETLRNTCKRKKR